jgi:Lrp/AsnC family transcriptional regulator, leucine-responsive regulatory protein
MLDTFDRRILTALQRNNRQSMAHLGDEIGLSEPAVRRRVARLRRDGYILADVSLLDPARLGITVIISIRFAKESQQTYDAFKAEILRTPEIAQGYTVTGDDDFILIGHFLDMISYDDWINARILTNQAIYRSTTNVVYRRVKFETAIPLGPE